MTATFSPPSRVSLVYHMVTTPQETKRLVLNMRMIVEDKGCDRKEDGKAVRGEARAVARLFEEPLAGRAEDCLNSCGNHRLLLSVKLREQAYQAWIGVSASAEHGRIR